MKLISILTLLTVTTVNAVKNDLVTQKELWKYVSAVDKILNYCSEHRFQVDMNMYHGLFLMKVFLNQYWNNNLTSLSLPVRNKINTMKKKQQYLVNYFNTKVKEDKRPSDHANKRIYTLINHYGPWISKLKKFRTNTWDEPIPSDKKLEELYSTWDVYSKNVMDIFNFKNTTIIPMLVARCLENIAHNPRNNNINATRNCTSIDVCRYVIGHEVDYGYVVTHKLVVLQNAHYGRGCYIFYKELDEELTKRYCQVMYAEAVYIGKHDKDYFFTDLHMEQIMLCGLEGYADFLKKSWISTILKMQDPSGCMKFNKGTNRTNELKHISRDGADSKNIDGNNEWEIVKVPDLDAMEKAPCNVHTTGVAIGTLALAIRYILDSLNILNVKKSGEQKNVTKVPKQRKTKTQS